MFTGPRGKRRAATFGILAAVLLGFVGAAGVAVAGDGPSIAVKTTTDQWRELPDKTWRDVALKGNRDVITYTFEVTNTGNQELRDVQLSNPAEPATSPRLCADGKSTCGTLIALPLTKMTTPPTCSTPLPATLAPGASLTCTSAYTLTQDEVEMFQPAYNTKTTVTGTTAAGDKVTANDTREVAISQVGIMPGKLTADKSQVSRVGETITYTFVATNTGTLLAKNAEVTALNSGPDWVKPSAYTCSPASPIAVLWPGESFTCTATYTVTQDDLNRGKIKTSAKGDAYTGPKDERDWVPSMGGWLKGIGGSANVVVDVAAPGSVTLAKTANTEVFAKAGEGVQYGFIATNNGPVPLTGVTITDKRPGVSALSCDTPQPAALDPGNTLICTATYTTKVADYNAAVVENTATVTGKDPQGNTVTATASYTIRLKDPN